MRSHTGSSGTEFTFTGEQNDPNGLEYLRARYYDPATGRFVSRDPIPHLNSYIYAGNNPVNVTDPSGRECNMIDGDACGAFDCGIIGGLGGGGGGAVAIGASLRWLGRQVGVAGLALVGMFLSDATSEDESSGTPEEVQLPILPAPVPTDANKIHHILANPDHNFDLVPLPDEEILEAITAIGNDPATLSGVIEVEGGSAEVHIGGLSGQLVQVNLFIPAGGGMTQVADAWVLLP